MDVKSALVWSKTVGAPALDTAQRPLSGEGLNLPLLCLQTESSTPNLHIAFLSPSSFNKYAYKDTVSVLRGLTSVWADVAEVSQVVSIVH